MRTTARRRSLDLAGVQVRMGPDECVRSFGGLLMFRRFSSTAWLRVLLFYAKVVGSDNIEGMHKTAVHQEVATY